MLKILDSICLTRLFLFVWCRYVVHRAALLHPSPPSNNPSLSASAPPLSTFDRVSRDVEILVTNSALSSHSVASPVANSASLQATASSLPRYAAMSLRSALEGAASKLMLETMRVLHNCMLLNTGLYFEAYSFAHSHAHSRTLSGYAYGSAEAMSNGLKPLPGTVTW